MSTTSSKSSADVANTAPTFSYAQAAKGRSGSQQLASGSSKAASETSETTDRITSSQKELESVGAAQPVANGESASSSRSDLLSTENIAKSKVEGGPATSSTQSGPGGALQSPQGSGTAPSSLPGDGPPANLPKDEYVSATPNESESTWDKVSQNSQIEDKAEPKSEGDGDDSKLSSWEHVPPAAQLKEAPPPVVNVWQKRAANFQSKTLDAKPTPIPSGQNQRPESLPVLGQRKASEPSIDAAKVDIRRKSSGIRQITDEKVVGTKDAVKTNDSKNRSGDEDKIATKGGRSPASIKPSSAPPPPPSDSISWPTPESAKDEDKKKPQDRNEKSELEKTPNKPHVKEKWVQMPYVPTAVFNTPLPTARRGGRPARGGREGSGRGSHTANGSVSGNERSQAGLSSNISATPSSDRVKGDMGPPRPGPLPPRTKRASSAGPSTAREQRRNGETLQAKTEEIIQKPFPNSRSTTLENRRGSSAQTDALRQISPPERKQQSNEADAGTKPHFGSQEHAHPRSLSGRGEPGGRVQDFPRESGGFPQSRERVEGRPERGGRGGYRGRGGHNAFGSGHTMNGQGFPMGPPSASTAQGFTPSKSQSYTEQRHQPQSQNTLFSNSREPRHYRTGSRSQSIPNPTFSRYSGNGGAPSNQPLPLLQTDTANMYYQQTQPGVMSAMPFPNYVEHMQLSGMVQMQMEYYFSVDNLCKDMFLRKHMDSQGFVFLTVLQNFNRIKQLTSDLELIRLVCWRSPLIELLTGGDGLDRVRKAQDWQQWVLSVDERVPSAQNDGPSQLSQPQISFYGPGEGQRFPVSSPRSSITSSHYRPEPIIMNGHGAANQTGDEPITQTPLSAAVPDFTPSLQPLTSQAFQTLDTSHPETTFSDEQIESLMIVVRKPNAAAMPLKSPPAPAVTNFKNGSAEPRLVADELSSVNNSSATPNSTPNGDHTPESGNTEGARNVISPLMFGTAPRQPSATVPPVFWVKDKDTPVDDLPNDLTYELYTAFRREALKQREQIPKDQPHHDMDILFQFWSHFLVRNFNLTMYEEFRHLALEDANRRESQIGMRNLITFYDESVLGSKILPDSIARDYIELVRTEHGNETKPALDKLRAAWRNGAFPLKNRVKIDRIIDPELKRELES